MILRWCYLSAHSIWCFDCLLTWALFFSAICQVQFVWMQPKEERQWPFSEILVAHCWWRKTDNIRWSALSTEEEEIILHGLQRPLIAMTLKEEIKGNKTSSCASWTTVMWNNIFAIDLSPWRYFDDTETNADQNLKTKMLLWVLESATWSNVTLLMYSWDALSWFYPLHPTCLMQDL